MLTTMHKNTSVFLTVLITTLSLLVFSTPAFAQNTMGLDRANSRAQERMTTSRQVRAASSAAGIRRSCETIQKAVVGRMSRLVEMANTMMSNFDKHSQRVQEYYLTVLVPAGITVPNYDDLLADIAAKEAVVQTTIANARADVNNFNCDTNDPRTYIEEFRADMQAVKTALKEYRASIVRLIVAVRTAAEKLEPESL